jgi:hypothetical protein
MDGIQKSVSPFYCNLHLSQSTSRYGGVSRCTDVYTAPTSSTAGSFLQFRVLLGRLTLEASRDKRSFYACAVLAMFCALVTGLVSISNTPFLHSCLTVLFADEKERSRSDKSNGLIFLDERKSTPAKITLIH